MLDTKPWFAAKNFVMSARWLLAERYWHKRRLNKKYIKYGYITRHQILHQMHYKARDIIYTARQDPMHYISHITRHKASHLKHKDAQDNTRATLRHKNDFSGVTRNKAL